jgi:hypothetical protein
MIWEIFRKKMEEINAALTSNAFNAEMEHNMACREIRQYLYRKVRKFSITSTGPPQIGYFHLGN